LNRLAINLGWSIGPAVGGILASFNYSLLFWADGITCIVASAILLAVLSSGKKEKNADIHSETITSTSAYKDVIFMKGMFYLFLIALSFFQLFSVIPAYYKNVLLLNEAAIGWILAMNGLLIAAFEMILVYKLQNRGRTIAYITTGALLIGFSFLFLELGKAVPIAVAGMILVTIGEMFLFPFLNNFWVKRSTETNRGQYAAVYTMAFAAATVLAPTIATQIADRAGFTTLWAVDFLLCSFAALGFYSLKKKIT
jgi:predicted MFS family arabinose efflux permease